MDGDIGLERKRCRMEGGPASNLDQKIRGKGDSRPSTARPPDLVIGHMTERQMLRIALSQSLISAPPKPQSSDEEEEEEDDQRSPRSPRRHGRIGNDLASQNRASKGDLRCSGSKRKTSGNGKSGVGQVGEGLKGNRARKKVPANHEMRSPRKAGIHVKGPDAEGPIVVSCSGRDVPICLDPDLQQTLPVVARGASPPDHGFPSASGGSQITDSTMLDLGERARRAPQCAAAAASVSEEETMESRLQARRLAESDNSPVGSSSQGESPEASPESTQEIFMKRETTSSDPEDGASEDDRQVRRRSNKRSRDVLAGFKESAQEMKQTTAKGIENERPRLKVDVPNVTTPQKLDTVQGRAQVSTAQPAPDDKLAIPNAERPRKSLKESLLEMDCLNELMEENIFGRRSRPKSGRGAGDAGNVETISDGAGDSSQHGKADAAPRGQQSAGDTMHSPLGAPRTPYQSPFSQGGLTQRPSLRTPPNIGRLRAAESEETPRASRLTRLQQQAREGPSARGPRRSGRVAALESSERPLPSYQDEPPSPSFSQNRLSDWKPAHSSNTDADRQGPRTRPGLDAPTSRPDRATPGIRAPRSKPAASRRWCWGVSLGAASSKKPSGSLVPPLPPPLPSVQPVSYSYPFPGQHQLLAALDFLSKPAPSRGSQTCQQFAEDPFCSLRSSEPLLPLPPWTREGVARPEEAAPQPVADPTTSARPASLAEAPSSSPLAPEAARSATFPAQDASALGPVGTALPPRTPKLEEEGRPQVCSVHSSEEAAGDADANGASTPQPPRDNTGARVCRARAPRGVLFRSTSWERRADECSCQEGGVVACSIECADVAEPVLSSPWDDTVMDPISSPLGTALEQAAGSSLLAARVMEDSAEAPRACSASRKDSGLDGDASRHIHKDEGDCKVADPLQCVPPIVEMDEHDQGTSGQLQAGRTEGAIPPGTPPVGGTPSSCYEPSAWATIMEPSCVKKEPAEVEAGPGVGLPISEGSHLESGLTKTEPFLSLQPEATGVKADPDSVVGESVAVEVVMDLDPISLLEMLADTRPPSLKAEPAFVKTEPVALALESEPASLQTEAVALEMEPASLRTEPASAKTEPSCLATDGLEEKENCPLGCEICWRVAQRGVLTQHRPDEAWSCVLRSSQLRRVAVDSREPSTSTGLEAWTMPCNKYKLRGYVQDTVDRFLQAQDADVLPKEEEEEHDDDSEEDLQLPEFRLLQALELACNAELQENDYAALQIADQENVPRGRTTRSMPAPCLLRPMTSEIFDEDEEFLKQQEMCQLEDDVLEGTLASRTVKL